MIRHPSQSQALVYPIELENNNYVGVGMFILFGGASSEPEQSYRFDAIYGEEIINLNLVQTRRGKNSFLVVAPRIGNMEFLAHRMPNDTRYIGFQSELKNQVAIRRILPKYPEQLNEICKNHNFYFVGFSPRLSAG